MAAHTVTSFTMALGHPNEAVPSSVLAVFAVSMRVAASASDNVGWEALAVGYDRLPKSR